MMDLSSYLLRPIQRISKYSLLLQDMLALAGSYRPKDMIQDCLLRPSVSTQNVCGPGAYVPDLTSGERERERAEIQSAADLVRFQMRHGNDLLTMDAIRDCDVRHRKLSYRAFIVDERTTKVCFFPFVLPGEFEGAGSADSPR